MVNLIVVMKVIGVFDMKKIVISNIVILALLISSICLAFEPPVIGYLLLVMSKLKRGLMLIC